MKRSLLDVNLLLALAWPNHQHHSAAQEWFATHSQKGWATCTFTQLGFIRLSSNPAFTAEAVSPSEAAGLLQRWTRLKSHRVWASIDADLPLIYARAIGHQQINDAWLVELARKNSGKLVTFDPRLSAHAPEQGLVEVINS